MNFENIFLKEPKFTWQVRQQKKTFYAQTNVKIGGNSHIVAMHRLITGLVSSEIDHKNRTIIVESEKL